MVMTKMRGERDRMKAGKHGIEIIMRRYKIEWSKLLAIKRKNADSHLN